MTQADRDTPVSRSAPIAISRWRTYNDDKKDEKEEPAKPAGGFFANLGGENDYVIIT